MGRIIKRIEKGDPHWCVTKNVGYFQSVVSKLGGLKIEIYMETTKDIKVLR